MYQYKLYVKIKRNCILFLKKKKGAVFVFFSLVLIHINTLPRVDFYKILNLKFNIYSHIFKS